MRRLKTTGRQQGGAIFAGKSWLAACRVLKSAEIVSEMMVECHIGYSVYVVYIDMYIYNMLYYIYTHKRRCIQHICIYLVVYIFVLQSFFGCFQEVIL